MTWTFTIPLPPRGKGRPRATSIAGHARMYTDSKTRSYEGSVAVCAEAALPSEPLEGPLRVDILAVLPRPKRLMRKKDRDDFIWCPSRPDADNIRKAVLDGMKACWRDDAQVCGGETLKVYAERDGRPRTVVMVSRLTDGDLPIDSTGWQA